MAFFTQLYFFFPTYILIIQRISSKNFSLVSLTCLKALGTKSTIKYTKQAFSTRCTKNTTRELTEAWSI